MKILVLVSVALSAGVVPSLPFAAAAIQAERSEAQGAPLAVERPATVPQAKVLWMKGPRHMTPPGEPHVRTISESEAIQLMQRMRPDEGI
ncbi:MAG: hypothetical protein DI585_02585 [Pseudomonas fluorescens]|nr:MAG: hypothetical protein DI585_02585 [Pseudomonas fluorescens]